MSLKTVEQAIQRRYADLKAARDSVDYVDSESRQTQNSHSEAGRKREVVLKKMNNVDIVDIVVDIPTSDSSGTTQPLSPMHTTDNDPAVIHETRVETISKSTVSTEYTCPTADKTLGNCVGTLAESTESTECNCHSAVGILGTRVGTLSESTLSTESIVHSKSESPEIGPLPPTNSTESTESIGVPIVEECGSIVVPTESESMTQVDFKDKSYPCLAWEPAIGRIGGTISFDTETTAIDDPAFIQDYVLGTACDGQRVFIIRRQDLGAFCQIHSDCKDVYTHTASYDLEVATKACGFDFHPMIEAGRIRDISIYYRLKECATKGEVPHRYSLALMCSERLGVELEKEDGVRTDFGRFYQDGTVDYASIPWTHIKYAAIDAIATFRLAVVLESECRALHEQAFPFTHGEQRPRFGWLGHDIQLRGDVALRALEHFGVSVDPIAVEKLDQSLTVEIDTCRAVLERYGYSIGKPGNQAVFEQIICGIEQQRGITIPVTPKSGRKSQAAEDLVPFIDHEFVGAFIRLKELEKTRTTYLRHLKTGKGKVFAHYTLMLKTGRTSCSKPNVQNLPRIGGVRECFVASQGYVLLPDDYHMLELCTLAQTTYTSFGFSRMRDLINHGVDLHQHIASLVLNKPPELVTKEERQKAKPVNFGLPGGMGVSGLQAYARDSYGVVLSEAEVEHWRSVWFTEFPEMRLYLDGNDTLTRLANTLTLRKFPHKYQGFKKEIAAALVMRVAGGATETTVGRVYSVEEIDWAWAQIATGRAGSNKKFESDIRTRKGSQELQRAIVPGRSVSIPTGRIRANCTFTEAKNWPFQALAADGAKIALYDLIRAGYRVVAFIHDEFLVEVPESEGYNTVAEDVSRIMIDAMQRVCPDVKIRTEHLVMRRWSKAAKVVKDKNGRLLAWDDATPNGVGEGGAHPNDACC